MCLICVDMIKQKMSWDEGKRNANEIGIYGSNEKERQHARDLFDALHDHDFDKLRKILNEGSDE